MNWLLLLYLWSLLDLLLVAFFTAVAYAYAFTFVLNVKHFGLALELLRLELGFADNLDH